MLGNFGFEFWLAFKCSAVKSDYIYLSAIGCSRKKYD